MNSIANEITKKLNEKNNEFYDLHDSGKSWQGEWTKLLKKIITELGQKKYCVSTSGLEDIADEGEWLFDLVWSKLNGKGDKSTIVDIPLVLESEISDISFGGFKTDFDKLFVATGSTKVFVTRNIDESILEECKEYAQNAVNENIRIQKGDGIYLIVWQEIKNKDFELIFIKK